MSKVIDEVVFKKALESMLQELSDTCLYDFVPYQDEEISELFSLTPEEAQSLSELISDEVVSKFKLWSSSKVNDSLILAKSECNDYTDKMLANISSISIKYVDTLPTSDISTSTIYILKNTTGGNDTLNLYDGANWTVIGDFVISLDDYYNKTELDAKLDEKANKTEVLLQDDVIVDKTLATTSNVLSAKTVVDELDLKANDTDLTTHTGDADIHTSATEKASYVKKTDISTTINSTSTNDTVPTNKAVYDSLINKLDNTVVLNTADEVNSFDKAYQSFIVYTSIADAIGLPDSPSSTWFCIHLSHSKGYIYPSQIAFEYAGLKRIMYRTAAKGVWSTWRKIPTIGVEDVAKTIITFPNTTYYESAVADSCYYFVKNGICYINLRIKVIAPTTLSTDCVITGLPKAATTINQTISPINIGTKGMQLYQGGATLNLRHGEVGGQYEIFYSYPVAES